MIYKTLLLSLGISFLVVAFYPMNLQYMHGDVVISIPSFYLVLGLVWIFFFGVTLGKISSSFQKYRLRVNLEYYQKNSKALEERLDQAKWIFARLEEKKPILRYREIVEDLMAKTGPAFAIAQQYEQNIETPEDTIGFLSRPVQQSLKEQRVIDKVRTLKNHPFKAIDLLSDLSWDCWKSKEFVGALLPYWEDFHSGVQKWLLLKIHPSLWSQEHLASLFHTIEQESDKMSWLTLMEKAGWLGHKQTQEISQKVMLLRSDTQK